MIDSSLNALLGPLWLSATVSAAAPGTTTFEQLAERCAPSVHPRTLQKIVSVESAHNPFAIGVVNGSIKQPKNLLEAVLAAERLERQGKNFSMGLAQVNRYNLQPFGESYRTIFEPCRNLKTGAAILTGCYLRAKEKTTDPQQALRAALSCYYSGNFSRGFKKEANGTSYVERVVQAKTDANKRIPIVPAIEEGTAIPTTKPPSLARKSITVKSTARAINSTEARTAESATAPGWIQQYATPASSTAATPFVTHYQEPHHE